MTDHIIVNKGHDHIIPMEGGPFCGTSITLKGSRLPHEVPMFYRNKFYIYNLIIKEEDAFTAVYYEFNNVVMEIEAS